MFAALKAIKLAFQTLGCRTVGPPTLRNDDWVGLVPSRSAVPTTQTPQEDRGTLLGVQNYPSLSLSIFFYPAGN